MPSYTIEILALAEAEIAGLSLGVRGRVIRRIDALVANPRPPGVKKLQGGGDLYRVRVGDYRIIYRIQDAIVTVTVVRVRRRDKAY